MMLTLITPLSDRSYELIIFPRLIHGLLAQACHIIMVGIY
jgi:hypothetical protein